MIKSNGSRGPKPPLRFADYSATPTDFDLSRLYWAKGSSLTVRNNSGEVIQEINDDETSPQEGLDILLSVARIYSQDNSQVTIRMHRPQKSGRRATFLLAEFVDGTIVRYCRPPWR